MHTIDTILGRPTSPEKSRPWRETQGILARAMNWIFWRAQIRRSRTDLLSLNDSQLRDIGLTRDQAGLEGGLPWWR